MSVPDECKVFNLLVSGLQNIFMM